MTDMFSAQTRDSSVIHARAAPNSANGYNAKRSRPGDAGPNTLTGLEECSIGAIPKSPDKLRNSAKLLGERTERLSRGDGQGKTPQMDCVAAREGNWRRSVRFFCVCAFILTKSVHTAKTLCYCYH
jgi:hypothetical protein